MILTTQAGGFVLCDCCWEMSWAYVIRLEGGASTTIAAITPPGWIPFHDLKHNVRHACRKCYNLGRLKTFEAGM